MDNANVTLLHPHIQPRGLPAETAVEQAAAHLRESIIAGWLRRGQPLTLRDTARDMGTSLGVIREAFARLCDEGFLMRTPRGTAVAPLCLEAFRLLQRRLLLEVQLTRLATKRLAPFGLRLMHQIRQEMVEAQQRYDLPTVQRTNYRFHNVLYRFAGRPDLVAEVQSLWAAFPFDLMTTMPSRMPAVAEEHAAIMAALDAGDVRKAGHAMHYHIVEGWRQFEHYYPLRHERAARQAQRR